jgi:hypothetical protein
MGYLSAVAALLGLLVVLRTLLRKRSSLPLPPSPPADPLIGHIRLMPSKDEAIFFHELGKQYGEKNVCMPPVQRLISFRRHDVPKSSRSGHHCPESCEACLGPIRKAKHQL